MRDCDFDPEILAAVLIVEAILEKYGLLCPRWQGKGTKPCKTAAANLVWEIRIHHGRLQKFDVMRALTGLWQFVEREWHDGEISLEYSRENISYERIGAEAVDAIKHLDLRAT